jgi:hypothetical protein
MSIYTDAVAWTEDKSLTLIPAVISSGQQYSTVVSLGPALSVIGLYMPPTGGNWTTSAIQFSVSVDGVNYGPLITPAGSVFSIATPLKGYCYGIDQHYLLPFPFVRVRSSSTNQVLKTTLTVVAKANA